MGQKGNSRFPPPSFSAAVKSAIIEAVNKPDSSSFSSLPKDSGRWSLNPAEDFSSGVFSGSSQPDVQVFSVDLLNQAQQPPPPCCFEGAIKLSSDAVKATGDFVSRLPLFVGVDVRIKDFSRKSIRIREARRVKVGHIATGISDQVRPGRFARSRRMAPGRF